MGVENWVFMVGRFWVYDRARGVYDKRFFVEVGHFSICGRSEDAGTKEGI